MLNDVQREYLGRLLMTMRVIVAAMVSGVVMFFVVVLVLRGDQAAGQPMFAYVAAGFAVMAFAASLLVPQVMAGPVRQSIASESAPSEAVGDVLRLGALYQTRVILAVAFLEGAAFFNTIAYLLEGQVLTLVVTIALILAILSHFPTADRVENWVGKQEEIIEQMRSQDR